MAGLLVTVAAAVVLAAPALRAGSGPINDVDINKIKAEDVPRSQVEELASCPPPTRRTRS